MGLGARDRQQRTRCLHLPVAHQDRGRLRPKAGAHSARLWLCAARDRNSLNLRSIGAKLTGWYLGILALGLAIFGVSSWFGIQIVFSTVDEELLDRIHDVG